VVIVSAAGWTVKIVLPETEPLVAEMVVVPDATPEANPLALIVATAVPEDAHVTCVVMSLVVLSE
jgi:hypothetical protein